MKLKGEKELLAEELYTNVEDEYTSITLEIASYIKDLYDNDKLDLQYKLEEINSMSARLVLYKRIVTAIFNMNMGIEQIKVLKEISEQQRLLKILHQIINSNELKLNEVDKEYMLGIEIKKICSLHMVMRQDKNMERNSKNNE